MEPIREAEMQTQPGKRLNEESKKSGKGPLLIAGIVLAVLLAAYAGLCAYAGSLDTFYPNRHISRKAGPIWPPSPVAGPAVPIGRTWTKPPFPKPYPV